MGACIYLACTTIEYHLDNFLSGLPWLAGNEGEEMGGGILRVNHLPCQQLSSCLSLSSEAQVHQDHAWRGGREGSGMLLF